MCASGDFCFLLGDRTQPLDMFVLAMFCCGPVRALNSDGSNPIHFATRADQARVFMKLGKHVDIRDADGATALHIAAKENAVDAAKVWPDTCVVSLLLL